MLNRKCVAWALGLVFVLSSGVSSAPIVYLVRHAEKVDDSRDPELSEKGRARARMLAELLASAGVERIFSTDFIRTRETARPLAETLGLEVELYRELDSLAAVLKSETGRVLVVGHSNTTPAMVELLGGEPSGPIQDDVYDRLYIVVPSRGDAPVETVLLRLPNPEP